MYPDILFLGLKVSLSCTENQQDRIRERRRKGEKGRQQDIYIYTDLGREEVKVEERRGGHDKAIDH